ncbi:MAG: dCTP deaminase [Candidatus Nanohaloarchaeota archaeon]|nr:dCTP deaminase [Candidatus Nanohaloarchaeota archaeon]
MSILSDKDIKERIKKGEIVIEPLENLEKSLGPSSLDLRLGNKFRVFKHAHVDIIDPKNYHDELIREYEIKNGRIKIKEHTYTTLYISDEPFIIHPGEFILASTYEKVKIPADITARLEGRSSLGRLGLLVHVTAGYIDPGFEGHITLELGNVGKLPLKLYPGMRVCQLVFEEMTSPSETPYNKRKNSKYLGENGATSSRIKLDF